MAQRDFKRGIENAEVLSEARDFFSSSLGQAIVHAEHAGTRAFQVCIRDGYFNVYWRGCSVLRYQPSRANRSFSIHYKYLPAGCCQQVDPKKPYLSLDYQGGSDLVWGNYSFREHILSGARAGMIPAFEPYVCRKDKKPGEKTLLSRYLAETRPLLLDLEVAFTRKRKPQEMTEKSRLFVADRVDFARLVIDSGKPSLQLVEAKLTTDSRLRAGTGRIPEMMTQMARYREFIERESTQIEESYRRVAENYLALGLLDWSQQDLDILRAFVKEPILDSQPHLLVLGTQKEMQGRRQFCHWQRLQDLFAEQKYPEAEMWALSSN